MEVELYLYIEDEVHQAGSSVYGELSITTQIPLSSVQIDIFLSLKESVDFRSSDQLKQSLDKLVKSKKSLSNCTFPYNYLNPGSTYIKFELELPSILASSCIIDNNSNIGEISYKVKATLKSEGTIKGTCGKDIQISPHVTGIAILEHNIQLRGCCLNYGSVIVYSNFPNLAWKFNDIVDISLDFNNANCSVPITQISYELWKKVHLRDSDKNTQTNMDLITRGLESMDVKPREALLSASPVAIRINLKEVQDRIQKHVSIVSEFIHCEYSIKFTVTAKTCCGLIQGSFTRPLMIHF